MSNYPLIGVSKKHIRRLKERIVSDLVETEAFKGLVDAALKPYKEEIEQAKALATRALRAQQERDRQERIRDIDLRLQALYERGVPRTSLDLARPLLISEEASMQEVILEFGEDGEVTKESSVEQQVWKLLEQQAVPISYLTPEEEEEQLWQQAEAQFGEVWPALIGRGEADKSGS